MNEFLPNFACQIEVSLVNPLDKHNVSLEEPYTGSKVSSLDVERVAIVDAVSRCWPEGSHAPPINPLKLQIYNMSE